MQQLCQKYCRKTVENSAITRRAPNNYLSQNPPLHFQWRHRVRTVKGQLENTIKSALQIIPTALKEISKYREKKGFWSIGKFLTFLSTQWQHDIHHGQLSSSNLCFTWHWLVILEHTETPDTTVAAIPVVQWVISVSGRWHNGTGWTWTGPERLQWCTPRKKT